MRLTLQVWRSRSYNPRNSCQIDEEEVFPLFTSQLLSGNDRSVMNLGIPCLQRKF